MLEGFKPNEKTEFVLPIDGCDGAAREGAAANEKMGLDEAPVVVKAIEALLLAEEEAEPVAAKEKGDGPELVVEVKSEDDVDCQEPELIAAVVEDDSTAVDPETLLVAGAETEFMAPKVKTGSAESTVEAKTGVSEDFKELEPIAAVVEENSTEVDPETDLELNGLSTGIEEATFADVDALNPKRPVPSPEVTEDGKLEGIML